MPSRLVPAGHQVRRRDHVRGVDLQDPRAHFALPGEMQFLLAFPLASRIDLQFVSEMVRSTMVLQYVTFLDSEVLDS